MKYLYNIEKSKFHHGEYIGYALGIWRIEKNRLSGWQWLAYMPDDNTPNPRNIRTRTLQDMSKELSKYEALKLATDGIPATEYKLS